MSRFEPLMFHKPSACFHAVVCGADVTSSVVFPLFPFLLLCAAPLWHPITNRKHLSQQPITTPLGSSSSNQLSPPEGIREEHMHLGECNQPFTDCLSRNSCLRSQSARERTMESWGSEEEEAFPRLGEGRAEERGVRGVTVSSSILRSCCDRTVW